jgi:hypothetical protein
MTKIVLPLLSKIRVTIALEIDVLWIYLRLAHDLEAISRGFYEALSYLPALG